MSEEASSADVLKELRVLLGDEWKRTLGKRTAQLVVVTLVIAGLELTYGLPIITLATTPFIGALIVFLWDSVATWIQSRKPQVVFYACSEEGIFIPIQWSDLPRHRKRRACQCGASLVKTCPSGKHFIVSPEPTAQPGANPKPPERDSVCPFCDPSLPLDDRRYLPSKGRAGVLGAQGDHSGK